MIEEELWHRVRLIRTALEGRRDGLVTGDVPDGNNSVQVPDGPLEDYYGFLRGCDGPRCGDIDIWTYSDLENQQFRIAHLENEGKLLCIGQLLYDPLTVEQSTGLVRLFAQEPGDEAGESLGRVEYFFRHCVFGEGYGKLVPDPDEDSWYRLLIELGLA
jgi:hypothetical protein